MMMKKERQPRRQRRRRGVHSSYWIGLSWIFCELLLLCLSFPVVNGFANNLIVTSVGCMTELDTSEVIMNNMVKAVDESDFPKMHLVVVDSQNNNIESPYHYNQQQQQTEIVVKFENPYTKEEFDDDVQYVMEILGPENDHEEGDDPPTTNPDAEWIHGGTIGCDNNKRVAARIQDYGGRATIQIHNPTKQIQILAGWATGQNSVRLTPTLILEPSPQQEIETDGQGQGEENGDATIKDDADILSKVRDARNGKLLDVVEKVQSKVASKKNEKKQEENINDIISGEEDESNRKGMKAQGHKKERIQKRDEDEGGNTIKVHNKEEFMEVAKKLKMKREAAAQQRSGELSHEVTSNENNDDRQQSSSDDRPELKPINHRNSIHQLQQQQQQQPQKQQLLHETHHGNNKKRPNNAASPAWNQKSEEARRRQLEKQMNENFPDHHIRELQMKSYLWACSFYLICIGLILMMFGKKKEKGRRDL